MANALQGRRVAILAADGVEQVELEKPRQAVLDEGATVELVSLDTGEIQAMNGDIDKGDRFPVDRKVADAEVGDFDALLLPGGTMNPTTCARTPRRSSSPATSCAPASRSG